MADSIQPNTTLYINNLNDRINKDEIRSQLYALFTTYGKLIDVVATKTPKMRGQAFLVFTDLPSATAALRACDGVIFYNKPLRISYAKSKSYATLRREDPKFIPPNLSHASSAKRLREAEESNMRAKRERLDEDDEEMDIDDDDDDEAGAPAPTTSNTQVQPSNKLHCSNLPQEVTNGVLAVLFQQYRGFQTAQVKPSTKPNATGEKVKTAEVVFENAQLAAAARQMLDGFQLKKGWNMAVTFLP
ncbi:RNA-binding domain-containing protein [Russula ochroleuca]|jgi:RNA recognition motif-containing protein|uniref:RNA-binding domain-containing protein n=1 Tax=Russula ochroleuca TaxID=152965 RepID=A0A9P5N1Y2_9AGAM|nr:RNA-binding domain-containing protein [Russula ochroleuca]